MRRYGQEEAWQSVLGQALGSGYLWGGRDIGREIVRQVVLPMMGWSFTEDASFLVPEDFLLIFAESLNPLGKKRKQ